MPSAPQISPCGVTPKPHPLAARAREAWAWIGMDAQPQHGNREHSMGIPASTGLWGCSAAAARPLLCSPCSTYKTDSQSPAADCQTTCKVSCPGAKDKLDYVGREEEAVKFWSQTLALKRFPLLLKEHDAARNIGTIWFAQPLRQGEKTEYSLWIIRFVVQGYLK